MTRSSFVAFGVVGGLFVLGACQVTAGTSGVKTGSPPPAPPSPPSTAPTAAPVSPPPAATAAAGPSRPVRLPSGRAIGHNQVGCSEDAKLSYVVAADNSLYSFDPRNLKFQKRGTLNCTAVAKPFAMSIDRKGTAWISYSNGALFTANTADAKCTATNYKPRPDFPAFALAWVSSRKDAREETLYMSPFFKGVSGSLWKVDAKLEATKIGSFTDGLQGKVPDLTGDGEGRLYAFFPEPPARIAEIDPASAKTESAKQDPLDEVKIGNGAWAITLWGGDQWLFTADKGNKPSRLIRIRKSGDNSSTEVMGDVGGFTVVGAGASTCAPLAPPQ